MSKTYEILNVGQGDSMVIRPPAGCRCSKETLIVDLGPGNYDITKHIKPEDKVHIFLTHHDNDHLEGLRFFIGKMHQVSEITVPLYQNEITLIARAILNLKGIRDSRDCDEFVKALEEIVNNQVILKTLTEENEDTPRLSFAYDGGNSPCKHIEYMNPPLIAESYDWLHEMDKDAIRTVMTEFFTAEFADEMVVYFQAAEEKYMAEDSMRFYRYWLGNRQEEEGRLLGIKCNYVMNFIVENTLLFRRFNMERSRKVLKKIYKNYVKCTHDVCLVMKMCYPGEKSMLLTGDASKKVFKRLIRENPKAISAYYLKMPHHGSKHNMDEAILDSINPKSVIISHNNGRFGKAKDSHPNQEVLDMLADRSIKILITNDVVKNGIRVMKKELHKKDTLVEIR